MTPAGQPRTQLADSGTLSRPIDSGAYGDRPFSIRLFDCRIVRRRERRMVSPQIALIAKLSVCQRVFGETHG